MGTNEGQVLTNRRILLVILLTFLAETLLRPTKPLLASTMQAASLPPAVMQNGTPLHQIGKGSQSYFGLKVYHVTLWGANQRWNPDEPHALDLESNRSVSSELLVDAGAKEMNRLGVGTPQQRQAWRAELQRLMPSVKSGDQLVVYCAPNHKTFFYLNGNERGQLADPAFGAAFFSIWLDPRTSNPGLRKSLLNH